ncbi:hypothetical protein D3C71_1675910 [compost metagenome]
MDPNQVRVVLRVEDPVEQDHVVHPAAHKAHHPGHVQRHTQHRADQRVEQIKHRRNKQIGEFDRFGNTHAHRGDDRRDHQGRHFFLLAFLRGGVNRQPRTQRAKDADIAVKGVARRRELLAQRHGRSRVGGDVLDPVGVETTIHHRRAEEEREIDEAV